MKKILVLILLICLFGCSQSTSKKLEKLGYSEEDVELIETFPEETQELFLDSYSDIYVNLIHHDNFNIDNFNQYLDYYGLLDDDLMIELVNNGIMNQNNCDKLVELYNSPYYVERLEDLYLKYLDDYNDVRLMIEIVNTNRYEPLYTDIKVTDTSKNYMMLINKYHQLPAEYEPEDLVDIEDTYGRGQTRQAVYDAFVSMANDALEAGYTIRVTSAYRSYYYQEGLYNKYLNLENGNQEVVDTYSARPGHSEHQSGLCLDIVTPGFSMDDFGLSDASTWVNENCYKYGFIIRYTEDKVDITGYQAEPWQIRYIGDEDAAKYIKETGITFDEYYTCFVEE